MNQKTVPTVRAPRTLDVVPRLPRLQPIRVRKALSQRELARVAGVSADTIRRIEAQGASAQFPTVRKLAEALGVEPAELMAPEDLNQ